MAEAVQTIRANVSLVTYCHTSGWLQMKRQAKIRDWAEVWGVAEGVAPAVSSPPEAGDPGGCGTSAVKGPLGMSACKGCRK